MINVYVSKHDGVTHLGNGEIHQLAARSTLRVNDHTGLGTGPEKLVGTITPRN